MQITIQISSSTTSSWATMTSGMTPSARKSGPKSAVNLYQTRERRTKIEKLINSGILLTVEIVGIMKGHKAFTQPLKLTMDTQEWQINLEMKSSRWELLKECQPIDSVLFITMMSTETKTQNLSKESKSKRNLWIKNRWNLYHSHNRSTLKK